MKFFVVFLFIGLQVLVSVTSANWTNPNGIEAKDIVNLGGRRYYFSNILVNAAEGLSLCQEINMTLAGFETVEEYITIINHIENIHGWGANGFYFTSGVRHTNIWIWGNVGLPMTYFVWNSGPDIEPDFTTDLTTQQCLVLSPNGMWDGYCHHLANFVCEQLGV